MKSTGDELTVGRSQAEPPDRGPWGGKISNTISKETSLFFHGTQASRSALRPARHELALHGLAQLCCGRGVQWTIALDSTYTLTVHSLHEAHNGLSHR